MPKSYSQDFREEVIKCVNQGKSCNAASVKFDIAANTVRNWYKRYKSEGHYKERDRLGKKGKIYKIEFEKYISLNQNLTLAQAGKHFGISIRVASYYMKKFGYSYKKNRLPTWKQNQK
ncbi:helix-turn-helix domain-containing protein [Orientia tsutsugamushi]|uniref:IS630 family transposase n=1 Tax=Orientia tsutsugamushi TaxID=784 RepID=A0A2U3RGB6_ORITS|nr:IS630 transposase-related protein [Orientia tsutsugamushi]KJV55418.1 transposase family protein [Orientia tsutsugamushi str. Kato PP]SPR12261.1 IS630 family transposase [Orientia tsutsugamushi]